MVITLLRAQYACLRIGDRAIRRRSDRPWSMAFAAIDADGCGTKWPGWWRGPGVPPQPDRPGAWIVDVPARSGGVLAVDDRMSKRAVIAHRRSELAVVHWRRPASSTAPPSGEPRLIVGSWSASARQSGCCSQLRAAAATAAAPTTFRRRHAEQIVLVGILDQHLDDVALRQMAGVAQMDLAVDLRRVGLRAAGGAAFARRPRR